MMSGIVCISRCVGAFQVLVLLEPFFFFFFFHVEMNSVPVNDEVVVLL